MRRGVKPELMSLRSLVCSGGSRLIMSSDAAASSPSSPRSGRNGFGRVVEAVPVARHPLHVGVVAHRPVAVGPRRMVVVRDRVVVAQLAEHLVREPLRVGLGAVEGRTVVRPCPHAHVHPLSSRRLPTTRHPGFTFLDGPAMLSRMRTRILPLLLAVVVLAGAVARPRRRVRRPRRASGCGRTASPGTTTVHVVVDGSTASTCARSPTATTRRARTPLILNFHGLGSNMEQQALYTETSTQRAVRRGYVVITPNGQGDVLRRWSFRRPRRRRTPTWRSCRRCCRRRQPLLCIDREPGLLDRACRTARCSRPLLACALPGRLAAIAPVAGVNATEVCSCGHAADLSCSRSTAPPIRSCPYAGGALLLGRAPRARLRSACPTRRTGRRRGRGWAAFDGCGTPPARPSSSPTTCNTSRGPTARSAARSSSTASSAAATPGPAPSPSAPTAWAPTTASISATGLMLDFFDAHPRAR